MHSYIHRSYLDLDTYTNTYLHACTASYIPAYPRRYINTHTRTPTYVLTYFLTYIHTYRQTYIHSCPPHTATYPHHRGKRWILASTPTCRHTSAPSTTTYTTTGGWCGGERGLERLAHIYIYNMNDMILYWNIVWVLEKMFCRRVVATILAILPSPGTPMAHICIYIYIHCIFAAGL